MNCFTYLQCPDGGARPHGDHSSPRPRLSIQKKVSLTHEYRNVCPFGPDRLQRGRLFRGVLPSLLYA
jgi:hypothetical protein